MLCVKFGTSPTVFSAINLAHFIYHLSVANFSIEFNDIMLDTKFGKNHLILNGYLLLHFEVYTSIMLYAISHYISPSIAYEQCQILHKAYHMTCAKLSTKHIV